MSALPRKLLFLMLFMLVHFVICRIEELLLMRGSWDWSRVVDPFSVRVRALKAILARRGIDIGGRIERKELSELVYSSGRLTEVEMTEALQSDVMAVESESEAKTEENPTVTLFSGLAHFDELVEDCKDSAWLVDVRHDESHRVPDKLSTTWRRLALYLRYFDIRLGRVDCRRTISLCNRKGWNQPGFLLAMPKGRHRMKDSVVYNWFSGSLGYSTVLAMLEFALATRVPQLEGGLPTLRQLWNKSQAADSSPGFGDDSAGDFILAIDLDRLREVPLLLSALSVRFTGRVRFWRVNTTEGRALFAGGGKARPADADADADVDGRGRPKSVPALKRPEPATFFLVSGGGQRVYEYGARPDWSEATTFRALELFLKMNYPEANDVFMGLLSVVCMLALLSLAVRQPGGPVYRILSCVWSFCFYVFLFFVLYPPLVHLLSHRSLRACRSALLAGCQVLARSALGGLLRRDCLAGRYSSWRLAGLFAVFVVVVAVIESRRSGDEEINEESTDREPIRRRAPPPYDPEAARMDHMVNYLYSSLWLPPDDLEKDYVDRLPVWHWVSESSVAAEQDTRPDNEGRNGEEMGWPVGTIYTGQCSVCLSDNMYGSKLCSLPCGHVFHEKCVKAWLMRPEKDSCPNCRWPAFKVK